LKSSRLTFPKQSVLLAMIAALAGCGLTPGSGPSRGAIVDGALGSPEQEASASYALVEIDDHALSRLARRKPPSLRGFFGDYRPSATQAIGVGDALQITLWEAASGGLFSSGDGNVSPGARSAPIPEQTVGRDGSITVPYAGRIRAAGRTPSEVETAIVEQLQGKAVEPQALVNVSRNVSNTATVTGEVANGARVPLSQRGDRILDVIAAAGGYRSPVHETFISLTRGKQTARAPLQALLTNPAENVFVRPGDTLTVESRPPTFTVAGATGVNAVIPFDARGASLDEAIGKAGGLNDNRADADGLFVLRYEPAELVRDFPNAPRQLLSTPMVPVAYHLNMKDPGALFAAKRFAIRDRDILYVSNAPLAEIGKVVQLIQMVAQPAVQGYAVSRIGN
jgi:polysaccharide biosynthesis/export protein